MADDIRRVRDNLEVVYEDFVKLLRVTPTWNHDFLSESELRSAWYAILAARECLACTVCRLNPHGVPPDGLKPPAPHAGREVKHGK